MKLALSTLTLLCVALAVPFTPYQTPLADADAFLEQFDGSNPEWKESHAQRDGEFSYVGRWLVEPAEVSVLEGDKGLVAKSPAAHHAISYKLKTPFINKGKDLVLQYETKFQKGLNCGGGYIKLLSAGPELDEDFNNDTPYQVMFGPDKCGSTNKVHFIVKRKLPDGTYEEKHLRTPPMAKVLDLSTLYTLVIRKDNSFEVRINGEVAKAGNLLDELLFSPSFNPPKEIEDPDDVKPEDWVDEAEIPDPEQPEKPADWDEDAPLKIRDPSAVKPADWDEDMPAYIPDPDAEKPEDWDDEEDGEWIAVEIPNPECEKHGCGPWEAPLIDNPDYKGKWTQPYIPNPDYKGPWAPRMIPNPDYYEDINASDLEPIGGLGFELWTMDKDLYFDNIYLGHLVEEAEKIGNETTKVKLELELKLKEEEYKKADLKVDSPITDEESPSWTEQASEYLEFGLMFAEAFINQANNFMVDLLDDPITVLTDRKKEGLVYAAVFGLIFSVVFGVVAVVLLKLTLGLDEGVNATMTGKEMREKREKDELEKLEKLVKKQQTEKQQSEKLEKIEEDVKSTSVKTSKTEVSKRG